MGVAERTGTGSLMGARLFTALIPLLCGLVAVLVANVPVTLVGGLVPAPLLGLIPIYFWCLVRPDLMTPAATFAIGILQDILAGGPPGIWTLSFVLTYAVVARQRDSFAGLSGLGAVLGFATAALDHLRRCLSRHRSALLWTSAARRPHCRRTGDHGAILHSRRLPDRRHSSPPGRSAENGFLMPLFDKKDKSRYATFTRRSLGTGAAMTAVFAVLAGRLYQLQIRDGDEYMTAAEDNRISERLLPPPRGRILTASASNSPTTSAIIACCWCRNRRRRACPRRSTRCPR